MYINLCCKATLQKEKINKALILHLNHGHSNIRKFGANEIPS